MSEEAEKHFIENLGYNLNESRYNEEDIFRVMQSFSDKQNKELMPKELLKEMIEGLEELQGEFQDGWKPTIDRAKEHLKLLINYDTLKP